MAINAIDKRLEAIEAEKAQLLALKEAGVTDATSAIQQAVQIITTNIETARSLARAFKLDFRIPIDDWKGLTYSANYDQFYDPDDSGWSSSSLGC